MDTNLINMLMTAMAERQARIPVETSQNWIVVAGIIGTAITAILGFLTSLLLKVKADVNSNLSKMTEEARLGRESIARMAQTIATFEEREKGQIKADATREAIASVIVPVEPAK